MPLGYGEQPTPSDWPMNRFKGMTPRTGCDNPQEPWDQLYWFPRAVIAKYRKLCRLEQQKCTVSQVWRPKGENQDVRRASVPLKVTEAALFQAALLASGSFLPCGSITPSFTWCSFSKNTAHIATKGQATDHPQGFPSVSVCE